MTALADDRVTDFAGRQPMRGSYGVKANVQIFKDSLVCLDSAGRAMPGGTIASGALFAVGKSSAKYDNRTVSQAFVPLSGLADACQVQVEFGIFGWTNSAGADAIAAANVGQVCYVVDDQTVALTSAGGTRPVAGIITEYRDSQVFVLSSPDAAGFLAQDVAAPAVSMFRARNVVNGNVADLAAYVVASDANLNDATLNVAGDIVLLVAQTTASQNGLYSVGTVATGTAPLTRISSLAAGRVVLADELEIAVSVGTVFGHTKWFNSAAGTIGTDAPAFFPESVTISQALVAGTMTLTSVPILSATKSQVIAYRKTANTCTLTTGGYVTSGAATPGALGTASVVVMAAVAAGTINNADVSTLHITFTNR